MRVALCSLEELLSAAGPRLVEHRSMSPPILIFTDGAFELAGSSVGGILIVPGMRWQAFGATLTDKAAKALSKVGQTQIIGQVEILPVVVAKEIWSM